MRRRESVLDVYTLFVGLLLALSPWFVAYVHHQASTDIWISGLIVALSSVAAIVAFSDWEEWLNLALGGWLIASPWLLGFPHTKAMHIAIGGGAVIVYIAALELWLIHYDTPQASKGGAGDSRARQH
jgi:SPW repeat